VDVPLAYYLCLSAVLFAVGAVGVLTRRNVIVVFIAFSAYLGSIAGQALVFFVMAVAAAEAAVGLAIVISVYRNRQTVNIDEINILKW